MNARQHVRYCRSADGTRIAFAATGRGPPLVKAANYLSHLDQDWASPVWRPWLDALGERNTLVRYDERGTGLSDRDATRLTTEAWVEDLEAVVDALGLRSFALFGISQGAAVSVAYAVAHPDRVTHLVLYGGYARGRFNRDLTPEERLEAETLINVMRVGWGRDNPAFRQVFSTFMMPEADARLIDSLNDLARVSAAPETAARMERAMYGIDVTRLAPRVAVPTLLLHPRGDACIPFEEGRILAALIPGARFVPLESRNHILLEREPAFARFIEEVRAFLAAGNGAFPDLTGREREVLDLLAAGLGNARIGDVLGTSHKTVRNHLTHVFDKLGVSTRAEAIVRARDAGFGRDPG